MNEQFVTYEIALELKKLGFDEPCFGFWNVSQINNSYRDLKYGMCIFKNTSIELSKYPKNVLAPLWQQVIDWFREEHNLHINFSVNQFGYGIMFSIIDLKQSTCIHNLQGWVVNCYTYYEARTQAILKALELINKTIT